MIIGTKAEFEQLADFILRDYLGNTYDGYDPLDIQAFAKDYLKLDISDQLAGSYLFSANGCELPYQKFTQKPCDGR